MAATRLIAMHMNKGKSIQKCLKDRTDYAQNGEKTNDGELVSSYECDPKLKKSKESYVQPKEENIDMLLDIQAIISKGKGPGYERWAKVHNIKQMAQTLLFLEEHDLRE